ncbi:MAG: hypothetical protein WCK86_16175 [Planctomycetia bacterium]
MSTLSWWTGWVASCKPLYLREDSRLVRGDRKDGLPKKLVRQNGVYAVNLWWPRSAGSVV